MVAGRLSHTLALPTCAVHSGGSGGDGLVHSGGSSSDGHASACSHDATVVPTFAALDRAIERRGPRGSGVDVVGATYWRGADGNRSRQLAWRTMEVVPLARDETYVCREDQTGGPCCCLAAAVWLPPAARG